MNYDLVIARYGEVGLKSSKVRSRFEKKLIENIKTSIDCDINRNQGRIYIFPKDYDDCLNKMNKIFGIVSYSPAISTESSYDKIDATLTEYTKTLINENAINENTKFAIRCRRVGDHDFTSQEMAAYCGGVVRKQIKASVDLTNPHLTIYVEIRDEKTFIYHKKIPGPGGLPLGTQGKVVCLVSGGIDSPVATYLMMKRGCEVIALYCDNEPFTTQKAHENYNKLIDQLQTYASGVPIKKRVINYGEYLKKAKEDAPEKMTCILCKSGMYKLAEKLAIETGASAIVDGSSVGQVASQTLDNILTTRYGVNIPILSPLIGLDKLEITRIAEKIGTFEISKIDDGGCSAVPKYPETKCDLNRFINTCKDFNQDEILEEVFNTSLNRNV